MLKPIRMIRCGVSTVAILLAMSTFAGAQTPLPNGMQIRLSPGFKYEPKRGIDSVVGAIVKEGLTISFEMGPVPAPGGLRLSGHFFNQAQNMQADERQWSKESEVGGRKIYAAYSKTQMLVVSSVSATEGVNFHATAKTPEEVADVLLMVFSLERAAKKE